MPLQPFSEGHNVGAKFDQEREGVVVWGNRSGDHFVVIKTECGGEIGFAGVGADYSVAVESVGVVEMVEEGSGEWKSEGVRAEHFDC